VTVAGQLVPGAVSQHVGMDLERQLGFLSGALDHSIEAIRGEWSAALAHELLMHFWRLDLYRCRTAECRMNYQFGAVRMT
jgi:hypothetical protein